MKGTWLSWYDQSLLNKPIVLRAKLLYHGTTFPYYKERMAAKGKYFFHEDPAMTSSRDGTVMFETRARAAVGWACAFAGKYKQAPVLLVVGTKKLRNLRRTAGHFWPYHRTDKIPKQDLIMIKLEFKSDKWKKPGLFYSAYRDLTHNCKQEIARAEAKLLEQF